MKHAKAQSPGHITGFFKIYANGSTGAGINIGNGMKTTVQFLADGKDKFYMNGKKEKLIVSKKVLELFRRKIRGKKRAKKNMHFNAVKVFHETNFPIGFGLGISGAGALSLALALNKLFYSNLQRKELTEIAKKAEIECGTGLGDVIAENYSGLMVGAKPYPSKKAVEIKCAEKFVALGFFKAIETKKIIRSAEWKKKINGIGKQCMVEMGKAKSMKKFISLSRKFSLETGLAKGKVLQAMQKIEGCSMSMLGETVFAPERSFREARAIERKMKKLCKKTAIAKIAVNGAGLS